MKGRDDLPKFTAELMRIYNANAGAYSEVTDREATGDKSVTIDRDEKNILYSVYNSSSIVRRVGHSLIDDVSRYKQFTVHNSNNQEYQTSLAVVHPKETGNELRLYFKSGEFSPRSGDIWFIFTRSGETLLHIGWSSRANWDSAIQAIHENDKKVVRFEAQEKIDDEDFEYQRQIGAAAVRLPIVSSVLKYNRNASIGLKAQESAGYRCEVDPNHNTFISVTGRPYVESHHLVPVSQQSRFPSASLDVEENIVALCPLCHRHLHYGIGESKKELIDRLWRSRKDRLSSREINISYEELLKIYMN